jgi:hypothetical protein
MPKLLVSSSLSALLVLSLCGCSVNVKKNGADAEKNVDINTPIGGIHVSKEADPHAIGLDVYPGSKLIEKGDDGNDDKSANVNISTSFFGLKVVAQEYQSDATPDKLIDYYTRELKKYGNVLQCHGSWKGGHARVNHSGDNSKQLKCDENSGDATELKVGTEDNQHIVSVATEGKGSKFALVLVQIRGKEDTI